MAPKPGHAGQSATRASEAAMAVLQFFGIEIPDNDVNQAQAG
jgi:hypothetical protein